MSVRWSMSEALGQGLFRTHIAERADQVSRQGQPDLALTVGQTKVGDPQGYRPRHRLAGWPLDVAVYHAQLMGMLQRLGCLHAQVGRRSERRPGRS